MWNFVKGLFEVCL